MSKLRIKLKYKEFEIELEGDKESVNEQFEDIKSNGLGNLFGGVQFEDKPVIVKADKPKGIPKPNFTEVEDVSEDNYPSLKEVAMKQLPSSESEWIVVYAFYVSEYGNKTFTIKDIIGMYEATKRKTTSRHANLSNNVKSLFSKGLFSALNDEDFIITDDGKHVINEILTRTHGAKIAQKAPRKKAKKIGNNNSNTKKKSSKSFSFEILKNLNLRPKGKISLIEYSEQYIVKSNPERIVVIVNYIDEVLGINPISANHIYTGLYVLKTKIPKTLYQVIVNTKSRNSWLDFETMDDIKLSIQGKNFIRLDAPKKNK